MIPITIISGGQSGADLGAMKAARARGVATGGWVPSGWQTEDGPAPWLAEYGLQEMPTSTYPPRTKKNVADADATLVFEAVASSGSALTRLECDRQGKPYRVVMLVRVPGGVRLAAAAHTPANIAEWLREIAARTVNVAGNRESKATGIGALVERFVGEVLDLLRGKP